MNSIVLSGRLTKKPELRTTINGNNVCSFSLAVKRDKDNTDFIDCNCYGKTAENLVKYQDKGNMIELTGRLENYTYTDKDNKNRIKTFVYVETINYISQPQTSENGANKEQINPYEEMSKRIEQENQLPF